MDYEFETENGIAKAIRITTSISEDEWPRFEPSNRSPGKYGLDLQNYRMTFINMEIRGLEAILSLYGVTEIDTANWKITFIPENDDENNVLQVTEFEQHTTREREAPSLNALGLDSLSLLIAASLHVELGPLTFPLSFFRKARISMMEGRFINAYYDFYFVLETLYGNGKTKNYAIKAEFKKSLKLQRAAKESLDFSEKNFSDETTRIAFMKHFKNYATHSLIDYIVDKRGFLHHHTARNRKIWHPSSENKFEIDALMIQGLAMHVLIDEVSSLFEDANVKADLQRT